MLDCCRRGGQGSPVQLQGLCSSHILYLTGAKHGAENVRLHDVDQICFCRIRQRCKLVGIAARIVDPACKHPSSAACIVPMAAYL